MICEKPGLATLRFYRKSNIAALWRLRLTEIPALALPRKTPALQAICSVARSHD